MANLPAIIQAGGLWCDRVREMKRLPAVGIAHQHIKDRRKRRPVRSLDFQPKGAGGTLWDYVPFYFAPRSPMLYTIHQGNVGGYSAGQRPVVHLETDVNRLRQERRAYAFSNGHGDMTISDFSDDLNCLQTFVDWSVMQGDYWNDTAEHPDRKRRRQAEFLLHEFAPWTCIRKIGVLDRHIAAEVRDLCSGGTFLPEITVERGWYY